MEYDIPFLKLCGWENLVKLFDKDASKLPDEVRVFNTLTKTEHIFHRNKRQNPHLYHDAKSFIKMFYMSK